MGQAQAQLHGENTTVPEPAVSHSEPFEELAKQFEDVLERAQNLGLDVLAEPIKDTASTLKDLQFARNSPSTKQRLLGSSCHCREWGPDRLGPHGEWICNVCGDKCQCDKSSWENIFYVESDREQNEISSTDDHEETQVQSLCRGKCSSSALPCCGCDTLKVKGKGSYETIGAGATSSEDDPTARSREEIVIVEASKSLQSKSESEGMPSISSSVKASYMSSKINHHEIRKKQGIKSRLTCPCGCGYFQEGEFKICPCGCGQVIEIVDELDKNNSESGGPGRDCAGDAGSDRLRDFSNFSMDTTNDSGVMTAIELLQMKCRVKDGMIAVLAEELRNSGNVDQIIENLAAPCLPHTAIDFNRSVLYEYLKRRSLPELHREERLTLDDYVPPPRNFRVARPILNSLYLAWDLPAELCNIRGYEILVNGVVTSRVRSATRSQAILTSIDLTRPTVLTIYSVATSGHISEPLTITFPDRKYA